MGAIALLYGLVCYVIFFAAFLYLIAFVGGGMVESVSGMSIRDFVPKTLDWGEPAGARGPAALIDLGLLLLFGVQHSVMAREGFKKWWTRIVPPSVERSTYVLITSLVLILLYVAWRPLPVIVWQVDDPLWANVLTALFFLGFGLVLLATFLINHFALFGLMQVFYRALNKPMPESSFRTPLLYSMVRHPLYLGFIIAFWSAPTMTAGHLLFAAVWTIYIFVALGYEERDLLRVHGENYRKYMARVPMIIPFGMRKE
jgi:protein-S-isoprenylcysteine O-methyltransferase Ste14